MGGFVIMGFDGEVVEEIIDVMSVVVGLVVVVGI